MISGVRGDIISVMPKRAEAETLHERIATILNTEQRTMDVTEVLQALKDAGDEDVTRNSVNQVLSKGFYRESRGRYRIEQQQAAEQDDTSVSAAEPEESPVIEQPEPSNGNGHAPRRRRSQSVHSGLPDIADNVELRGFITAYGTLAVRALLDEIEQK